MSTKLEYAAAPITSGIARGLLSLLFGGADAVRRHLRRKASIRDLNRIDDRTLADIGLRRSEIHAIAVGVPGRRPR